MLFLVVWSARASRLEDEPNVGGGWILFCPRDRQRNDIKKLINGTNENIKTTKRIVCIEHSKDGNKTDENTWAIPLL